MKIPTFEHKDKFTGRDCSTKEGARLLARRIEEEWAACGHTVKTRLERMKSTRDHGFPLWCVRSDLINGYPRRNDGIE